jgi:hypothetical protein
MLYNKHINKKGEPFTIEHFRRLLLNFMILIIYLLEQLQLRALKSF